MLWCAVVFAFATLAFPGLTRVLWLYEVRVHGAPATSGPRFPYATAFLADWIAFVFALGASAVGWLGRPTLAGGGALRPVALLHERGLGRGSMALLAARLRRDGREAFALGYAGARDAETKAAHVAAALREIANASTAARVDVVTHGDAAIALRSAARNHGCLDVLGNVVSLGAPHQGSALASFFGWHAIAYLRPRSRYLSRLSEADPVPDAVNFTNIASTFDAIVFPVELAHYPGALNVTLDWVGHHALLTSERIYRLAKENLDVGPKG